MFHDRIIIRIPKWINPFVVSYGSDFSTPEKRMRFVLSLVQNTLQHKSGGPFGAALFECSSNALVAPGVNLVITECCSSAHAEIVALSLAQQQLGRFDLSNGGLCDYELVTSTAPCAMCLGAIPWSGITSLICGARDEDARGIGFDEGSKVKDWIEQLNQRGVTVATDVCRDEAITILQSYAASNGLIYNSRK